MNKRSVQGGILILALALSALACSFSLNDPEARNIRMAKDAEGSQTATQFNPQDKIFLVGDLAEAADETNLKTLWIAVAAEGIDANKTFWEHEEERNDGKFAIELPADAGPRPAGKYKIDIYLNGSLDRSLEFEVLKGPPTPTPPLEQPPGGAFDPGAAPGAALFENIHTGLNESDTQTTSSFAQSDNFYVHFLLNSAEGQAQYAAVLSAVSVEGVDPGFEFTRVETTGANGPQWVRFTSSLPWPVGIYRIDMLLNGTPAQALQVEVVRTNLGGAQIQNPFLTLDQQGQQPVTVFPSTNPTMYVHFTVNGAPSEIQVIGDLVARESSGLEPNTAVSTTQAAITNGSYVFSFRTESVWPAGRYTVFIYLGGQVASQLDLQVE